MSPRQINNLDELQGLTGQIAGVSGWHTIGQPAIDGFAALTGDRQWIHTDPVRAATESPWGGSIAHGFLTLSLLSQMAFEAVELRLGQTAIINYGLNRVRFPAPTPAGSRVRGQFTLLGCGARAGGLEVVWQAQIEAEGGEKPVCVAEWIWLVATSAVL